MFFLTFNIQSDIKHKTMPYNCCKVKASPFVSVREIKVMNGFNITLQTWPITRF